MSELDSLPTPEELAAARGATTANEPKRKPVEYPVTRPRVISIDPVTNSELPPQARDDEDEKPRRQQRSQQRQEQEDDRVPDKFKDKSREEILEMYQNLERKHGSLANEVGHMRNIVERIASGKRKDDLGIEEEETVNITSDELLSNPTEAIAKVVAASSKKAPKLEEEIALIRQEQAMERFRERHPTFEQDMGDPQFQKWLSQSAYRQRLAVRAAQDGDLDAADELFTGWEEIKGANGTDDDDRGTGNDEDLDARERMKRDAHLERGGSRGASKAFGQRIYSKAEILKLRLEDPERYYSPEMQEILTAAYAEGRVR